MLRCRAAFDPKTSPLSPDHVHIIATANLTVLSVNSSHSGFTGGSLLNLQVELSDVLLTWMLQLAGKYAPSPTNTTSISFLKHCDGSGLLGKSNTNKNTQLLLLSASTGISVRL